MKKRSRPPKHIPLIKKHSRTGGNMFHSTQIKKVIETCSWKDLVVAAYLVCILPSFFFSSPNTNLGGTLPRTV
ncbi:MAG: hypothetical protein LZF86_190376 [Nitrospira sp.]|nr:MAG: hypothetical protein LZF86_190376 [Nitrospira sp.]